MQDDLTAILEKPLLPQGLTLKQASNTNPLLIIFLRHFGCTFCRETLSKLSADRAVIDKAGVKPVLIHMGSEVEASLFFAKFNLANEWQISDPGCNIYKAFGLQQGTLQQLLGTRSLVRGFVDGAIFKHGIGIPKGDIFQMPGTFLLHKGRILNSHIPVSAADEALFDLNAICTLQA